MVRSTKRGPSNVDDIPIKSLYEHFFEKFFNEGQCNSDVYRQAVQFVDEKYKQISELESNKTVSESMIIKYIKHLWLGCVPGIDCLMAEHFTHAIGTPVIRMMCIMFTLCVRFGIVPSSFGKGLLIPLLKKLTLDPSCAKHYRPVTISSTLSKLFELYILDMVGEYPYCDLQFRFVYLFKNLRI